MKKKSKTTLNSGSDKEKNKEKVAEDVPPAIELVGGGPQYLEEGISDKFDGGSYYHAFIINKEGKEYYIAIDKDKEWKKKLVRIIGRYYANVFVTIQRRKNCCKRRSIKNKDYPYDGGMIIHYNFGTSENHLLVATRSFPITQLQVYDINEDGTFKNN